MVSHGSALLGSTPGMKYSQVRHWASKIGIKLKYRGTYEEFPEWRKQVMSAAHMLSINMDLTVPTVQKLIDLDPSNHQSHQSSRKNSTL